MSAPPFSLSRHRRHATAELAASPRLDERQFQLSVKRLADSLAFGNDRSPFLGSGLEYVQSRLYQPGDPVRALDWRLLGRTGKAWIKEYEAPKRLPVWLLLDTSASMTISSQPVSKYGWAVQLAGALALASLDRAAPVGLLGVGGRDLRREPSLSRGQIYEWLYQLRRWRFDEPTTLGRRLRELGPSLPEKSVLVVLSDLQEAAAVPALTLLVQRHEVMVLQLRDPAEGGLARSGLVRAEAAESAEAWVSRGGQGWVAPDASAALRRAGVAHLLVRIDQPVLAPVRHFLNSRGGLARMVR